VPCGGGGGGIQDTGPQSGGTATGQPNHTQQVSHRHENLQ